MVGIPRSNRREVRNPVLALPSAVKLQAQPADIRRELAQLFVDLAADATARAHECWRKHKAPMAVYWKAVAVYARHVARMLRAPPSAAANANRVRIPEDPLCA